MSYVIQFIIFTLLFGYQFTKLYKTLLETVLELQEENSISMHFNNRVKTLPCNKRRFLFIS